MNLLKNLVRALRSKSEEATQKAELKAQKIKNLGEDLFSFAEMPAGLAGRLKTKK
ncbi:MAG: hypothetical protein LAT68_08940 [Cyclobacteriaceae bacterium]|nr:hypothetical protein [Cyclobacteriaceae bacterium]MCH8516441.1 hypothetical protein [Cyclobacteriaceae bacterium]